MRQMRTRKATPGDRDLLAAFGVVLVVLAIGLWQPLVGLGVLGVVLVAVAFLTAPEGANDGS